MKLGGPNSPNGTEKKVDAETTTNTISNARGLSSPFLYPGIFIPSSLTINTKSNPTNGQRQGIQIKNTYAELKLRHFSQGLYIKHMIDLTGRQASMPRSTPPKPILNLIIYYPTSVKIDQKSISSCFHGRSSILMHLGIA